MGERRSREAGRRRGEGRWRRRVKGEVWCAQWRVGAGRCAAPPQPTRPCAPTFFSPLREMSTDWSEWGDNAQIPPLCARWLTTDGDARERRGWCSGQGKRRRGGMRIIALNGEMVGRKARRPAEAINALLDITLSTAASPDEHNKKTEKYSKIAAQSVVILKISTPLLVMREETWPSNMPPSCAGKS